MQQLTNQADRFCALAGLGRERQVDDLEYTAHRWALVQAVGQEPDRLTTALVAFDDRAPRKQRGDATVALHHQIEKGLGAIGLADVVIGLQQLTQNFGQKLRIDLRGFLEMLDGGIVGVGAARQAPEQNVAAHTADVDRNRLPRQPSSLVEFAARTRLIGKFAVELGDQRRGAVAGGRAQALRHFDCAVPVAFLLIDRNQVPQRRRRVLIDGQQRGVTPYQRALLSGTHDLTLVLSGYADHRQPLDIQSGKTLTIDVPLTPGVSQTQLTESPLTPGRPPRPLWRYLVGGGLMASGLLVGGLGVSALGQNGQCGDTSAPPEGAPCNFLYDTGKVGGGLLGVSAGLVVGGALIMAWPTKAPSPYPGK